MWPIWMGSTYLAWDVTSCVGKTFLTDHFSIYIENVAHGPLKMVIYWAIYHVSGKHDLLKVHRGHTWHIFMCHNLHIFDHPLPPISKYTDMWHGEQCWSLCGRLDQKTCLSLGFDLVWGTAESDVAGRSVCYISIIPYERFGMTIQSTHTLWLGDTVLVLVPAKNPSMNVIRCIHLMKYGLVIKSTHTQICNTVMGCGS